MLKKQGRMVSVLNRKRSKDMKKIILFFLFTLHSVCNAQIVIQINYDNLGVDKTKAFLSKYDCYIIDRANKIPLVYNDSSFSVDKEYIDLSHFMNCDQGIVLLFKHRKKCYYALFPNFVKTLSINDLRIKPGKGVCVFLKGVYIKVKKGYHTNFQPNLCGSDNNITNIPINMISCKKYKGEFDEGFEGYYKKQTE